ncbi:MAG: YidC/Oxa1 family membrane protein insertase [Dethiobacter sp.]|nr:YidC/Oxa1 family membrane protein insertase [Dethiobacter sp.]
MQPIVDVAHVILLYLYNITGNYGIAIILLTVLTRMITLPLTNKQMSSAKAMQDLQPELKRLQEKYKNDKEKLNQETMALWKANKVNPAAGCLPLIVQFPILIAIFRLLADSERLYIDIVNFSPNFLFLDMTKPDPTFILPVLSAVTTWLQQKSMMTDKSQQAMMIAMPIMILVFSIRFPAGLVLYWVVGNLISIAHHYYLLKKPAGKGALKEE